MLGPPRRESLLTMWERFGAHGDLQAVFDADPPADVVEDMEDVDDILAGDMWDGGDYIAALRRRRGSRSVSEASGIWSRSRRPSRANGFRRRSTRDEMTETGPDGESQV